MSIAASACSVLALVCLSASAVHAADVSGTVRDTSGGVLPGVTVELRASGGAAPRTTVTDGQGAYRLDGVDAGRYQLTFTLINFATVRRDVDVSASTRVDVVMPLALNADVTVTGKRTFANLADVENPAENLVGIAQSASQGAITARQLEERPLMREGEVLETVPGVIVTQHSGEGKANQYFLRGFNLDHGTDFATTVAGLPINLPTHAHGQGYTDLNFLIPELVTGVQFSKGPYYADQGDFATAGSSNINYANVLDKPIAHVEAGGEGFARAVFAASPSVGSGHLVAAIEAAHNDGPWDHPDDYRKINGVLRYSRGDAVNGLSLTALGYRGTWNSTDQVALRAIDGGLIGRFGAIDPSDGGDTYRYGGIVDWQRAGSGGESSTRVTGYAVAYSLDLFSDFTYFLNDPVHGDQIEQADRRATYGGRVTHRRASRWGDRAVQNTVGVQLRTDDIMNVALYHTEARVRLQTESQASVVETEGGVFAQNEVEWTPWLRTMAGLRADAAWFTVNDALDARNSGRSNASLVSPKGGVTFGPWRGTEFYVNAGTGFHSNDARGTTIADNPDGTPANRVTPLVRAKGAEVGVRTVVLPHLQTTLSVWTLDLASELVFSGDEGTTEASRPSARRGVEFANYYSPRRWLVFDADVSWSRARFTQHDPIGDYVPEAVGTVVSAGATIDGYKRMFGSLRWRYFGPRALIEDDSVRSNATSLVNLQAGYTIGGHAKLAVDVFNLFNAADSDIDYFYVSRLPGEPLDGVADIHTHPTLPRTARATLIISF
ncbi:MAG TPA: TonB-dependent receptor [Vicinamibacterales bacterium]|nr:TonB-dependent receptor [Vicinamibacterales bacterium]